MNPKMLISAAFSGRNILIILLALSALPVISSFIEVNSVIYWAAFAVVYLFSLLRTLNSEKFHQRYNQKQRQKEIQNLNIECIDLANRHRKELPGGLYHKLRRVMDDREELVRFYYRSGNRNPLMERVLEQTLKLVLSYIHLIVNYSARLREIEGTNLSEISNRIASNQRKLNFTTDPALAEDLRNLIDMDQRLVSRVNEEKNELEKVETRLTYLERTINMLKRQAMTDIGESEELIRELDQIINEANAMDIVLEERKKARERARGF